MQTPRPWNLKWLETGQGTVLGPDGRSICAASTGGARPKEERHDNLALIVNAVNSHDQLVKALEDTRTYLDQVNYETASVPLEVLAVITNALALARGVKG